jgi:hypothetical protein
LHLSAKGYQLKAPRLILEIDIRKRLPVVVAHDEAGGGWALTGCTPGSAVSFETIAITASPEPPFMLPRSTRRRCMTDHKFGIHRHNGRAGFQIASSFERAA